MSILDSFKQWIRGLGLKESEIIVDEKTYKALQSKYDKTASDLTSAKTQITLLESEKDWLNKQLTELQNKHDKVKDYNAQVTFEYQKPQKTQNKPKQNTKKAKKTRRKRKPRPIICGDSPKTGVIKKYDDYYRLYVLNPKTGKHYLKKGELNDLKKCLKLFNEKGCPYNQFFEICSQIIPDKRLKSKDSADKNIYVTNEGNFIIRKSFKNKTVHFGTCATLEQAREVRDYLEFINWDFAYIARNVCSKNKGRVSKEEYYLLMKTYIETDTKYQEYLGNKETKEFYD